jgi:hypothetical protein
LWLGRIAGTPVIVVQKWMTTTPPGHLTLLAGGIDLEEDMPSSLAVNHRVQLACIARSDEEEGQLVT